MKVHPLYTLASWGAWGHCLQRARGGAGAGGARDWLIMGTLRRCLFCAGAGALARSDGRVRAARWLGLAAPARPPAQCCAGLHVHFGGGPPQTVARWGGPQRLAGHSVLAAKKWDLRTNLANVHQRDCSSLCLISSTTLPQDMLGCCHKQLQSLADTKVPCALPIELKSR